MNIIVLDSNLFLISLAVSFALHHKYGTVRLENEYYSNRMYCSKVLFTFGTRLL